MQASPNNANPSSFARGCKALQVKRHRKTGLLNLDSLQHGTCCQPLGAAKSSCLAMPGSVALYVPGPTSLQQCSKLLDGTLVVGAAGRRRGRRLLSIPQHNQEAALSMVAVYICHTLRLDSF
jgi:hypothetical protein